MSGYEFDVFLSYPRCPNPFNWMRNHFRPVLRDCLIDQLDYEPTVFFDEDIETGTDWPQRLEDALSRTKVLVSIYHPQYFQSPWCLAEWRSMAERERQLGLLTPSRTRGLIYPVLFSDSETFPDYARTRLWWDIKHWTVPYPGYQQTPDYVEFHRQVVGIAIELATLLRQVPPWESGWTVYRPDPVFRSPPLKPRL